MIRGTTPTLSFTLPFATDLLAEAWVTLSQEGKVVLDKNLQQCSCEENVLSLRLTQEDTLQLQHGCTTEIQLRVRTLEGDALASRILPVETARILKDGVI